MEKMALRKIQSHLILRVLVRCILKNHWSLTRRACDKTVA
ncbi:UNVERIFIED_CONTAM: hypothetical protein GTU68_011772 [Idotea baltica]|nr:hypothetical protein [Idotea baltica]